MKLLPQHICTVAMPHQPERCLYEISVLKTTDLSKQRLKRFNDLKA